jgi:hypothetical protein
VYHRFEADEIVETDEMDEIARQNHDENADLRIRGTDFQSVTPGLPPTTTVVRVHQKPDGSADLRVRSWDRFSICHRWTLFLQTPSPGPHTTPAGTFPEREPDPSAPRTRVHPNHNPGERPSVSWLVESPNPGSTSPIAHNPDRARSLKGNSPIARGCQSAAPVTPGDLCRHVQTWRSTPRGADLRIRGIDFQSVTPGLSSSKPRPQGRTPPRVPEKSHCSKRPWPRQSPEPDDKTRWSAAWPAARSEAGSPGPRSCLCDCHAHCPDL